MKTDMLMAMMTINRKTPREIILLINFAPITTGFAFGMFGVGIDFG
jgi:hypothetical protein